MLYDPDNELRNQLLALNFKSMSEDSEDWQSAYQSDLKKFGSHLKEKLLRLKEVGSDGNCLFRSVADQLEGNDSKHDKYRMAAITYIQEHKDEFVPFIEETFASYIFRMSNKGCWGGQMELNAMAHCFKFNVIIHQTDSPDQAHVYHEPIGSVPTIHLAYHLGCHYNSVRRADDPVVRNEVPVLKYPIGHQMDSLRAALRGKELNHDIVADHCYEGEDNYSQEVLDYAKLLLKADEKTTLQVMKECFTPQDYYLNKIDIDEVDEQKAKMLRAHRQLKSGAKEQPAPIQKVSQADRERLLAHLKQQNKRVSGSLNNVDSLKVVSAPLKFDKCHCKSNKPYFKCC